MALLRRKSSETPIAALERETADLVARRELLQRKLVEADAALVQARDDRRTVLLEASLDDESAVLKRDENVRGAEDRAGALRDALTVLVAKISGVESRLGELRDAAERNEIAAAVRAEADTLEAAREQFVVAGTELIRGMQAACARLPGTAADFLPRTSLLIASELPGAVAELIANARGYAEQVEQGHAVLHRPAPPPPVPEPVAAPIERIEIYALQNLCWSEANNQIMTVGKYSAAAIPVQLAETACRRNLAAPRKSERAEATIAAFGLLHQAPPPADMCIDISSLDQAAPEEQPAHAALPPGFVETVGPARRMEINVNRV
jgi:hypothetical protein